MPKIEPNPKTSRVALARHPTQDVEVVSLGVHQRTTHHLVDSGRLASLGEYYGLIYLSGVLTSPHVIFQGLNRPFLSPGIDDTIFAYLSPPSKTTRFYPKTGTLEAAPIAYQFPANRCS